MKIISGLTEHISSIDTFFTGEVMMVVVVGVVMTIIVIILLITIKK